MQKKNYEINQTDELYRRINKNIRSHKKMEFGLKLSILIQFSNPKLLYTDIRYNTVT